MWWLLALFVIFSMVSSEKRPNGERLPAVDWLHFPKTSSWMGDFLFMYACPHMRKEYDAMNNEEFFFELVKENATHVAKCETKILRGRDGGFGWHSPYVKEYSNGSTVALFRKPRSRLISAFLFEGGMMIPPGHLYSLNDSYQQEIFKYIRGSQYPIMTYASYLGIPSCQTKMVLGHNCGTEVPISEDDLKEAKRRVEEEFAFVGLTEESVASAKLFYAMYGKGIQEPDYKPYARLYRANEKASKDVRNNLIETMHNQKWSDPPEQALYQHVRKIFYERCKFYGIQTVEHYSEHHHRGGY